MAPLDTSDEGIPGLDELLPDQDQSRKNIWLHLNLGWRALRGSI